MSLEPDDLTPEGAIDTVALLQALRRKEGSWLDWGQACQQLQKAGLSPQGIFEETGFEPIQQNQITIAAQVYESLKIGETDPQALSHFQQRGSDLLYEFRILAQGDRQQAATLAWQKKLDGDGAHDIAKAIKAYSRLSSLPAGFTQEMGDGIAHYYWQLARQQRDLAQRSRLIAQGLSYAVSETARRELEKLLTDLSVVKGQGQPRLPLYRLDSEEELPRIIPLISEFPVPLATFHGVPSISAIAPFNAIQSAANMTWVALPGWQVILKATDPLGFICGIEQLPADLPNQESHFDESLASKTVLIVIDRGQTTWQGDRYFLVDQNGLELQWFPEPPEVPLLGQLVLVLRPKKVLDETVILEPWLLEE